MDNFVIAMSRYKRRRYDDCITLCDQMLDSNNQDQAAWLLKCNSLVRKSFIDDLELDEEGIGDILMDENQTSQLARPGTSFQRPLTSSNNLANPNPVVRPMSKSGRPLTGFARPSTNRPITSSQSSLTTAIQGARPGTNRPITQGGRYLRLATASLNASGNGQFIDVDKLNLKRIAQKGYLSKAICDYLIYVEHNAKKALELCAEATCLAKYEGLFLGVYREAEKQFKSSLKNQEIIKTHLELAKVYIRLDQPNTAIQIYESALQKFPYEISFLLGIGRIHEMLNDSLKGQEFFRKVLFFESLNLEAVASIASYYFYIDQPEVALRFYKRLIQLGVSNAELWNNMALCCFFDGQYDMFFICFQRAIQMADDSNKADIYYNISHIFVNAGDLQFAKMCLKLALTYDVKHSESYNNLGVIDNKLKNLESSKFNFSLAAKETQFLFEPVYNSALLCYQSGDYQQSYQYATKALEIYPDLEDGKQLANDLEEILNIF